MGMDRSIRREYRKETCVLFAIAVGLAGCPPPMESSRDGALDWGRDGSFQGTCSWGTVPSSWRSNTRVTEQTADGTCPVAVSIDGYAGYGNDCGMFDACCDYPSSCRFRVNLTFHDDRPQPCTGVVPCFPPMMHQREDCRCEAGAIRCGTSVVVGQSLIPFHICSDCYLPSSSVCGDGGRF